MERSSSKAAQLAALETVGLRNPETGGLPGTGLLYSVELSIGNCNSEFEHLNATLSGWASYLGPFDTEAWGGPAEELRFLLSTQAGDARPAAVQMTGWRG